MKVVTFGEIMLRLDPGEGRVRTAREFKVCEGGGEYNVARGLRRGLRSAIDHGARDFQLGSLRTQGQFLEGMAIAVARGEIHSAERRIAPQAFVDPADLFEPVLDEDQFRHGLGLTLTVPPSKKTAVCRSAAVELVQAGTSKKEKMSVRVLLGHGLVTWKRAAVAN